MTEKQPGNRKDKRESTPAPTPEQERRIQFSEVTIAAWTGEVSGQHLYDPRSGYASVSTSGMYGTNALQRALPDVAEGGYVIDLRPLADHPQITTWVFQAPMPNGRVEGDDIERFPDDVRKAAGEMAGPFGLQGAFQDLALLAAAKVGEPVDGSAGPFDTVSAAYRAVYWGSRGALIGKRVGNTLQWSNGTQQTIEGKVTPVPSPQKPIRRARGGK
ncbi:MAG TPA: hypothetical protein VNG51_22045 [Ktedonobacteraceae bacterium]|nr:hypothetical protein [Ktedonobacteraceae bacterium]